MPSKYHIIYQKPYHCAIACLSMIIYRHTNILIDQEEIGQKLGVRIPHKIKDIFVHDLEEMTNHGNDEWISTIDLAPLIEKIGREYIPSLSVEVLRYQDQDYDKLFRELLFQEKDIWIEWVLPMSSSDDVYIHDRLLDYYDDSYWLIDPDPKSKNILQTSIENVCRSIDGSRGKETWVLVVSK